MQRNYDTTTSRPYPRISSINILYPTTGVPVITYVEQQAIVDGDGVARHLDGEPTSHTLDLLSIQQPVQAKEPSTGLDIPGKTYVSDDVMLGLLAFLRADQLRRDGSS